MFKIFNAIKNAKAGAQTKLVDEEPKMSIKKWYALQQRLREEQMAMAQAADTLGIGNRCGGI